MVHISEKLLLFLPIAPRPPRVIRDIQMLSNFLSGRSLYLPYLTPHKIQTPVIPIAPRSTLGFRCSMTGRDR
jgi:hypothetical protein